jgi:hypothetical protein
MMLLGLILVLLVDLLQCSRFYDDKLSALRQLNFPQGAYSHSLHLHQTTPCVIEGIPKSI